MRRNTWCSSIAAGCPTRSVWMGTVAGVVGILADKFAHATVFAFLVNASGALMVFVYTMVAVSQIRLRRMRERSGASQPALRMWLFPLGELRDDRGNGGNPGRHGCDARSRHRALFQSGGTACRLHRLRGRAQPAGAPVRDSCVRDVTAGLV